MLTLSKTLAPACAGRYARAMTNPDRPEVYTAPLEEQLPAFIDQHREMLLGCLDGITEEEARARLVPSRTTLLGLVKHAGFVERVWFGEAVSGKSREELAQHCGHADILREQIFARRAPGESGTQPVA